MWSSLTPWTSCPTNIQTENWYVLQESPTGTRSYISILSHRFARFTALRCELRNNLNLIKSYGWTNESYQNLLPELGFFHAGRDEVCEFFNFSRHAVNLPFCPGTLWSPCFVTQFRKWSIFSWDIVELPMFPDYSICHELFFYQNEREWSVSTTWAASGRKVRLVGRSLPVCSASTLRKSTLVEIVIPRKNSSLIRTICY